MKKITALILILCLLTALSACGNDGIYIHDQPEVHTPVTSSTPEPEPLEPDPAVEEELGRPVILNIRSHIESYPAPDNSGKIILTYGYDDVSVYLQDNPSAADAMNQFLSMQDELFYSGSDSGDGVNAMLELATDNYTMSVNMENKQNTEFSCLRTAFIDRGDSRIITLRYRINNYTGGAHGLYSDRAYVFETSSGRLLTLADLSDNREALEQKILDHMNSTLETDIRYASIRDYMKTFYPDQDITEALKALLREGSWLLNEEGLVVFSDIYEIGSYADGIIRFTLPYAELAGILKADYMPLERRLEGSLQIEDIDSGSGTAVHLLDMVTVSDKGREFRVFAQGTVYDVTVDSVIYIDDQVGFYQADTHWYCSYLSNTGVQIRTDIPDGMPNLMIRYLDPEGNPHNELITESGEDGTVILLEQENVLAVG